MTKFKDFFNEVQCFSEWYWVIDFDLWVEIFYEEMKANKFWEDTDFTLEDFKERVKEDWVHFHINWADDEFWSNPARWLWSKNIKWAKKVLVYS